MSISWRFYALLTFVLFGTTNFILGYISEKTSLIKGASISSAIILWIGMGVLGLSTIIIHKTKKNSVFENVKIKYLIYAAVSGLSLSIGMLTLKLGFVFDPLSKGPIVAIISANSLVVALLSWYLLKEKLQKTQTIGFLIIITGILMISLSNFSRASLIGILFGVITMAFFAITNYILKYLGHKGLNSIKVVTILWTFSGIFGLIALNFDVFAGNQNIFLLPDLYKLFAFIAGIFLGFGMLSLKIALSKGPAGPIIAIAGSNAILVTVLDLIVFQQIPQSIKLAGMFITISGIFIATVLRK